MAALDATLTEGISCLGDDNKKDILRPLTENVCFRDNALKNVLYFDGTGDYVRLGSPYTVLDFERTESFSLSCRFKSSANGCIVSKMYTSGGNRYGYNIRIINDKLEICIACSSNTYLQRTSTNSVNDGLWHHAIMTYDGSSAMAGLKMYIDNIIDSGTTSGTTIDGSIKTEANQIDFQIGRWYCDGYEYFTGNITECMVFNKELSVSEIAILYRWGVITNGLQAYWDFHEGTGATLGDISGNSYDGTITDAVWQIAAVIPNLPKSISRTLTDAVDFIDVLTRPWTLLRTLTEGIKGRDVCNRGITRLLTDALSFLDAKAIFWKIFHGWRKKKSIDNTVWNRK